MCHTGRQLIYLVTLLTFSASRDVVFRFGNVERVDVGQPLTWIYSMYEDEMSPGRFIVANKTNLFYMDGVSQQASPFVGRLVPGTEDGVGENASFIHITDFAQGPGNDSESRVIYVAEFNISCVRKVDRQSLAVTRAISRCSNTFHGRVRPGESPLPAAEARFSIISSIKYFPTDGCYYILTFRGGQITRYDPKTDLVHYVYQYVFSGSWGMLPTTDYSAVYISFKYGVSKYHFQKQHLELITGSNHGYSHQRADGDLDSARFIDAGSLSWIIPDRVIGMAGFLSNSMRIINLSDKRVSSLCVGDGEQVRGGRISQCKLKKPLMMNVVNNTIYVGEERNSYPSPLVKIPFDIPQCIRRERGEDGKTSTVLHPVLTEISTTCNSTQGIANGHSRQVCRGSVDSSGELVGRWEPAVPPQCADLNAQEVLPSSGQVAGGTKVELRGVFPQEFTLTLKLDQSSEYCVKLGECDETEHQFYFTRVVGKVYFVMPSGEEFGIDGPITEDGVRLLMLIPGLPSLTYTYLPNPTIKQGAQLRQDFISSGGQEMLFPLDHLHSATRYTLEVLSRATDIAYQICEVTGEENSTVSCDLPNPSVSTTTSHGNAAVHGFVEATLTADGVPVNEVTDVPIELHPDPTFQQWQSEKVIVIPVARGIEVSTNITLAGEHLDAGAVASDYKIRLYSSNLTLMCSVLHLTSTTLTCSVDLINMQAVRTSMMVEIGNLQYSLGHVSLFTRSPELMP